MPNPNRSGSFIPGYNPVGLADNQPQGADLDRHLQMLAALQAQPKLQSAEGGPAQHPLLGMASQFGKAIGQSDPMGALSKLMMFLSPKAQGNPNGMGGRGQNPEEP